MADLSLIAPASVATTFASSSSHVYSDFDVFINHRGPDVKKGLASHLYRSLSQYGLRVFLDDQELEQGDAIAPQIQWAIGTASVHIAIFSARYAQSSWCLDELVMMLDSMLESRSTIIPIFYGVDPSELRWTRREGGLYGQALSIVQCICLCRLGEDGGYARDLRMLEKKRTTDSHSNKTKPRYDSNTVEKWRKALFDVSHISGFELKACNGNDEGLLLDKVVRRVLKKVRKTPLDVAQYPTGLEDKVKEFEETVSSQQQSRKTRVAGIVGLGGVGKSTLVKEFFNRHRSNYDVDCFVYDVGESAAKNSLNLLQATLLKDLAQRPNEQISGVNEGKHMLKRYLSSSRRALIVLDDIDHSYQLEALFLSVKEAIHPASLIIVTSRNRDVLISSGISESCIYRLTSLNREHSRELFCLHAFGPTYSVEGFGKVIDEFLDACQGLPPSLKVIGALFRGKSDLNHWKAQLRIISKMLPEDIQSTLKVSYDSLNEWEKQIFLDIACFFYRRRQGYRHKNMGRIPLGRMSEFLEAGKQMSCGCRQRKSNKNARPPQRPRQRSGRKGTPGTSALVQVRGISMVHLNDPEQSLENLAARNLLTNMRSLQLLWAGGYFAERVFSVRFLPQLIYLRWDNCPLSYLPSWIPMKNLRVLYLEGQILEKLWQHESQVPLQLRELHIEANRLKIIPNSIGKLQHLEKFILHGNDLETLADSVGYSTNLQSLDLSKCFNLRRLPDSVGQMTNLQSLDLRRCSALQMLPDSVGQMTSLENLYLSGCVELEELPAVEHLNSLVRLDVSNCPKLQCALN